MLTCLSTPPYFCVFPVSPFFCACPSPQELYRSRIDFLDVGTHNYWNLGEWTALLEGTGMFEDESFTREEGNLCFYLARFAVYSLVKDTARQWAGGGGQMVDKVWVCVRRGCCTRKGWQSAAWLLPRFFPGTASRPLLDCASSWALPGGRRFSAMDWLSFLEALGHVVRFKEMPRAADLAAAGHAHAGALLAAIQVGTRGQARVGRRHVGEQGGAAARGRAGWGGDTWASRGGAAAARRTLPLDPLSQPHCTRQRSRR